MGEVLTQDQIDALFNDDTSDEDEGNKVETVETAREEAAIIDGGEVGKVALRQESGSMMETEDENKSEDVCGTNRTIWFTYLSSHSIVR